MLYQRGPAERLLHALLFEILAIGISAPAAAWITGESMFSMGVLTAVIATMAVLWNMLYNWLFDRLQHRQGFQRTYWIRVIHACGFELGLLIIAIPFIAWWLNTPLWHALILDIGFVAFYLPYGFLFNLGYDKIRQKVVAAG
ncbi:MAG TPA: multidrug/biocide efflux PACE transporter [Castellaniella sp.]|nr:multidrug/biocide efflux PACE transporter [Castellaniella sp.]